MPLIKRICIATVALLLAAGAAASQDMIIEDAYLRSATPNAPSAAAFLIVKNRTGQDDLLLGVSSDIARHVALHRHSEDANGIMRMGEIDGGVPIRAGDSHTFARGGDHVMFMGLTAPLAQGDTVPVVIEFEKAGKIAVDIPVDHARKPVP